MHLDIEVRRADLRGEPVPCRLEDPVNGTVHRTDRFTTTMRADLGLAPGETTTWAAGALPDGRALTLDVVVRP